ncbi:uncharacterized protein PG986_009659 [Apiospora aurea]|uniref:Uncharacterized protein n=1 Tax=Apiospora aurea TaxID=335848 RepID=A0ABR1Q8E7_9PEZI
MGLPRLKELLYMGFMSGFRWNTTRDWSPKDNAYIFHALLDGNYTKPLVKEILQSANPKNDKGIPNLKKDSVCDMFAQIWNLAAMNVVHCKDMSPRAFFAACKAEVESAGTVPDEALYQFTLRAIHARNIFIEYQPGWKKSEGTSMSEAIDNFKEAFSTEYDIKYGLEEQEKPPRERDLAKIRKVMVMRTKNLEVHGEYFPVELTSGEAQGSSDNKYFVDVEYTKRMEALRAEGTVNTAMVDGQNGPLQPSGDVDPWWDFEIPVADSDDEVDYEDWEVDFLEGQEDEVAGAIMGGLDGVQNDAKLGDLAAALKLQDNDTMEVDE